MKKNTSALLIALCLLLTLSASLVACGHTCSFAEAWSTDADAHWHACEGEDCTEIADRAAHTWDEGSITTQATQEADGTKTFTCTVCAATRTEAVAFTGLSEEEWNAAFTDEVFTNFAYCELADVVTTGMTITTRTDYKFTEDNAWVKMTVASESEEMYAPDTVTALALRVQMIASIRDLVPYGSYRYDAETKTYRATEAIEVASIGASTSDITLTFAEGKLVEMKYTIAFTQDGLDFDATSTVTISDYGTVVLTPPAE